MRAIVIVLTVIAGMHGAIWFVTHRQQHAAQVEGRLPSVSYNRFAGPPALGKTVPAEQIRADLAVLAQQARAVRIYSSTQGLEVVPRIAAELGLDVTLGIWIDKDDARNEREIASALRLARANSNVKRLVVGNETVFRHERTAEEMTRIVERVKRDSPVPVGTAENWKIFVDHPQLAQAADADLAHIIPYWEGFSEQTAVASSLQIYDELRTTFPGKHIVIGEFGWPSAGTNFKKAVPGPISQATVLRNFVAQANELGSITISSKPSTSPKSCLRGVSDLIGVSSMRRCSRNFLGRHRWSMPIAGKLRCLPCCWVCCCQSRC